MLDGQTIILYGCGGHSRSVADVLLNNNPHINMIFVDKNAFQSESIYCFPVLLNIPLGLKNYKSFIAIGDNLKRKELHDNILHGKTITIISKKSHIGYNSRISDGCFVGNFCHIGPEVVIGKNTIINTGAIVEHETIIGEYCHIGPNSAISGRSRIGNFVFLGIGANIIDRVNICSHVTIGAGATVIKDIVEPGVYVGTPAKKVEKQE